jgi:hypothetical protein
MKTDMVTADDLRAARARKGSGFCVSGVSAWFEKNGMSMREFLKNGYPLERFNGLEDALSGPVLHEARTRHSSEQEGVING